MHRTVSCHNNARLQCLCFWLQSADQCMNTLWHVDLLLGNDHETSTYTTAIANGSANMHASLAMTEHRNNRRDIFYVVCERCNNQDQLAVAVRELLGFSHCEMLLSESSS
jgi:hypothetical protein